MAFELINKKHEDITSNQRVELAEFFKIEDTGVIYFSAGAAINFGLSGGLYIHFQNDGNKWYFYCNTDKDGFKLVTRNNKNCSLICDASLVKLIQRRTQCSIGTKFPIKLTKSKLNNHQIFEILFNKPIN